MVHMFSYLRVENTRLTDDVERVRLDNAHITERNNTLEQNYANDQQIIEELKLKNESLQSLQDRFDNDQLEINSLQEKCHLYEQEKETIQQENKLLQTKIEQVNKEKESIRNQLKQLEEKSSSNEKLLSDKTTEMYVKR